MNLDDLYAKRKEVEAEIKHLEALAKAKRDVPYNAIMEWARTFKGHYVRREAVLLYFPGSITVEIRRPWSDQYGSQCEIEVRSDDYIDRSMEEYMFEECRIVASVDDAKVALKELVLSVYAQVAEYHRAEAEAIGRAQQSFEDDWR